MSAPFRVRLFFWLILSTLSLFLAEVVSLSAPMPYLNKHGLLVQLPLYGLHTLVLAALIFRRKRVSLAMLYLAGCIFGLYEAYAMKVLWNPTWSPEWDLVIGGVYIMHTISLVLFWHPVMAFILPVMIAEACFTTSSETVPPVMHSRWGARIVALGLITWLGIRMGLNTRDPNLAILASVGAIVIITLMSILWALVTRSERYSLRSLLPQGREIVILMGMLLGYYGFHLMFIRTQAMPLTLVPHLTIWAMYAGLIGLLVAHLRLAPFADAFTASIPPIFPPLAWIAASALFPLAAVVFITARNADESIAFYGWKAIWYLEWGIGFALLGWSILSLFWKLTEIARGDRRDS